MRFVSTAVALLLHLSVGYSTILVILHFLYLEKFACWEVLFVIWKVYSVNVSHSARTFYDEIFSVCMDCTFRNVSRSATFNQLVVKKRAFKSVDAKALDC